MMWIRNGADYFIKPKRGKRNAGRGANTHNTANAAKKVAKSAAADFALLRDKKKAPARALQGALKVMVKRLKVERLRG